MFIACENGSAWLKRKNKINKLGFIYMFLFFSPRPPPCNYTLMLLYALWKYANSFSTNIFFFIYTLLVDGFWNHTIIIVNTAAARFCFFWKPFCSGITIIADVLWPMLFYIHKTPTELFCRWQQNIVKYVRVETIRIKSSLSIGII